MDVIYNKVLHYFILKKYRVQYRRRMYIIPKDNSPKGDIDVIFQVITLLTFYISYHTFVSIVQYSQHDVPLDNNMVPKKAANSYHKSCVARKSAIQVSVEI